MTANLDPKLTDVLSRLADEFGTPLYAYDEDRLTNNYNDFVQSFNVKKIKVHYACKALNNLSILKLFKSLGSGLDCVSEEEVYLGLHAGFQASDIMYTPNGVSFEEIQRVMEKGTGITIDNLSMLEKLGATNPNYPIHIRLNPHLMAGGNRKISVGHIDSKFGISIHQMPHVLRIVKNYGLNVAGIHVHTGSDIIDKDVFVRVAKLILGMAENFDTLNSVDLGSGFKVAYKEGDMFTNISELGLAFSDMFNQYCQDIGKDITLRFEPGKFLVSNAGYFLTSVNVIKQTTSCTFAGVDSGFNHLIRPMFYNAHHDIVNLTNPQGDPKLYSVVGNICETDTFADNRMIPEIREKDVLVFKNAGAYCFTMSSNYNSRRRPAEVLFNAKDYKLIRSRETFEDLLKGQL